jgi:hypothetical protein
VAKDSSTSAPAATKGGSDSRVANGWPTAQPYVVPKLVESLATIATQGNDATTIGHEHPAPALPWGSFEKSPHASSFASLAQRGVRAVDNASVATQPMHVSTKPNLVKNNMDKHGHPLDASRVAQSVQLATTSSGTDQSEVMRIEARLTAERAVDSANAVASTMDLNRRKTNQSHPIWCGGHAAHNCASCTEGQGSTWCNGDCEWTFGSCQFRVDLVWCGAHAAPSCHFCTKVGLQDMGYTWCHGDCMWSYPGFCTLPKTVPATGWSKPGKEADSYAPYVQANPKDAVTDQMGQA